MDQQVFTAIGVKKIITPDQVRTRGFTGNMLANQCHSNAAYLAKKYGGKRVSGFLILPNEEGFYDYLHHSIWLNPEGKYAEVTLKKKEQFAITEEREYADPTFTPTFNFSQIGRDKWVLYRQGYGGDEIHLSSPEMLNFTADLYKGGGSLREEVSVGMLSTLPTSDGLPAKQSYALGDRWDRIWLHRTYLRRLERKQAAVKRKARPD